ncbi:phage regulatory CII family protein [Vibrio sp. ZSDE26]|uniref:Phage regulatory CII family protein n=1 Tax=Vibrio amylolyticus TaxID=2847292 RepID=A0A9X1XID1_9VIBR|nr:phage regulatory CII family protein [Vibrio amylolyticus]MCK6263772.1 phage regulatory CII family protein [Vibrio amylolyticus]
MNDIDSMCEFRGSKQKAFNEACCAFANSENMTLLAQSIGMSPVMLRNKLNPAQPHVLSCTELITISKVTGNHTILNCLLLGLGVVTARIPLDVSEDSFVKRALDSSMYSGELSRMALEYAAKPRLTRSEKHKVVQTAQASISGHVLLINSLIQCNQPVTLGMVTDAIAIDEPDPYASSEAL